jgi:hypothetical protein
VAFLSNSYDLPPLVLYDLRATSSLKLSELVDLAISLTGHGIHEHHLVAESNLSIDSSYRCLGSAFDLDCAYSTTDSLCSMVLMMHKVRTGIISTESNRDVVTASVNAVPFFIRELSTFYARSHRFQ